MITKAPRYTDIAGIGFGPAQLAFAYALADAGLSRRAVFFEARDRFEWHPGMLLPDTTMQVNFTKDLVTPRRPTHPASFVNYLHEHGRLSAFMNLKTMFPSRAEFTQYFRWAADRVPCAVHYDRPIERVSWDATKEQFLVTSGDETWRARHIVTGLGLKPKVPSGAAMSSRVWHSEELLPQIHRLDPKRLSRIMVVGSGQSAAEVARYLVQQYPHATVTSMLQSYGFAPSDDSPFVNRIFDPEAVDDFYAASPKTRQDVLRMHANTNHSVVDIELIDELARMEYEQRFSPDPRFVVRNLTSLVSTETRGDTVEVGMKDLRTGRLEHETVDAVVMATGYRPAAPAALFDDPDSIFADVHDGMPEIDRLYRARLHDHISGSVWIHGSDETVHGLSSSLLSNIAVRGGEIAEALGGILRSAPIPEAAVVSA